MSKRTNCDIGQWVVQSLFTFIVLLHPLGMTFKSIVPMAWWQAHCFSRCGGEKKDSMLSLFFFSRQIECEVLQLYSYPVKQNYTSICTASLALRETWNVAFILGYCLPRIKLNLYGRNRIGVEMGVGVCDSIPDLSIVAQTLTVFPI